MKALKFYYVLSTITLVVLAGLLLFQYCANTLNIASILTDLLIGLVSALVLLILIEKRDRKRDVDEYGYLAGKYKRLGRFNETKENPSTRWKVVEAWNQDKPDIELIYKGNREYEIPAINYDIQWYAKATIIMDASNKTTGKGVYHYIVKSDSITQDFGTYELFVDEINNKKIYLFHQNYAPSGISIGYEVFERQL